MLGALHGDGHGDVTIAENLDRETATDSALGNQRVNGDLAALREQLPKSGDVDNLVFLLERALEATQLRQAHVQRQLAAFKARTNLVALLRTLVATTRSLTLGAFTTTDASTVLLGTRGGLQIVHLQEFIFVGHNQSASSTVTR